MYLHMQAHSSLSARREARRHPIDSSLFLKSGSSIGHRVVISRTASVRCAGIANLDIYSWPLSCRTFRSEIIVQFEGEKKEAQVQLPATPRLFVNVYKRV